MNWLHEAPLLDFDARFAVVSRCHCGLLLMLVAEEWGLSQTLRYLARAFGERWLRAFLTGRCGGLGSKGVEGAEK